jgi:RimJ/RimL family protein N-acetyltransferase
MNTIETPRLLLRPLRESDLDAYAEMCADAEVMEFLGGTVKRDMAWRQMATIIGHWQLRGFGFWAVEWKETGEFAGRLGCWQPEGWPDFEVGWALARPFWGRGIASEGARASLRHAFTELGRERVISLINPKNVNSIRVAERIGERHDGEAVIFDTPVNVYAITRAEWEATSGADA